MMNDARGFSFRSLITAAVIVSALGYFVDAYDILLFSIVRVTSLKDLGYSGEALTQNGLFLMNMQMGGMILGSILWGILGDKKGRLAVLFGSILLYSIANIANAFVHDVGSYAFWRFLAGLGLAGELGAGVTLVMEQMPQSKRGLGATIVGAVGVFGVVIAAIVADLFPWRISYIIGGCMGLVLLVLRATVRESQLFEKTRDQTHVRRGRFFLLFNNGKRFRLYLKCILVGVPTYFVISVLLTLSPEIGVAMGIQEPIKVSTAIMLAYLFCTFGDIVAGVISQMIKSRKKVVTLYLVCLSISIVCFYIVAPLSAVAYYVMASICGFFVGMWIVLVTLSGESFGTDLRVTVSSTVPNFIRGSTVLLNFGVAQLKFLGIIPASQIVGAVVLVIALVAVCLLPETFHRDLDFVENV